MAERCTEKHFVLVHGHVTVLLEKLGHKVTAVDLAASGRNVEDRLEDLLTIEDNHKPLYSFFQGLSEDEDKVILVGHSMGGYSVSSNMERFPEKISWGVFVSGFMVGPDLTVDNLGPKDLQLANLLVRPTRFFSDDESIKQLLVTKEKYGSVRRAFIVGHAVEERAEMQRRNAEKNRPDMVTEIQGADHMIMFSKPQELRNFLLEIAQQANSHPHS